MRALDTPPERRLALLETLAAADVRGGAAYDGLVGLTAAAHGCLLLTRDRRAATTYDQLGVSWQGL